MEKEIQSHNSKKNRKEKDNLPKIWMLLIYENREWIEAKNMLMENIDVFPSRVHTFYTSVSLGREKQKKLTS